MTNKSASVIMYLIQKEPTQTPDEKGNVERYLGNKRKGGLIHWTISQRQQFNMLVVWQTIIPID